MALVLNGDGKISGANLNIDSDGAATFTGLTVDTSTLHVDATNDVVGINNLNPAYTLDITRTVGNTDVLRLKGNASNSFIRFQDVDNSADYTVGADDLGVSAGAFVIYDRNASQYRLTMNSSGNVTMPYQPAFYAYQNADWTIAAATWQQNINLNSTRFNTGGHFNTSNGTFTAPVAGDYLFTHTAYFKSNTSDYFYMGIYVNGSVYTYIDGFNDAIGGVDNTRGGSVIIRLNANDAVTFWLYDGNGGAIGGGIQRTHVSGRLLG